ncbi:hypothetical protein [Methanocalculus chunghsingensis]|uniref:hypothetical protein n=1 Tax=Methanocalculus chunghsingensis TaxID=156457 RepID=UPI001B8C6930|nr:hypothetical protein [Methanocalculus chunghsingensis]
MSGPELGRDRSSVFGSPPPPGRNCPDAGTRIRADSLLPELLSDESPGKKASSM